MGNGKWASKSVRPEESFNITRMPNLMDHHLILLGLFKAWGGKKVNMLKAKCFAKYVHFGETFKALFSSLSASLTQFHDTFFKESLILLPDGKPRSEHPHCSLESNVLCKCFQDGKLHFFTLRHPELPCHIRTLGNKDMETHLSNFQNRAIRLH